MFHWLKEKKEKQTKEKLFQTREGRLSYIAKTMLDHCEFDLRNKDVTPNNYRQCLSLLDYVEIVKKDNEKYDYILYADIYRTILLDNTDHSFSLADIDLDLEEIINDIKEYQEEEGDKYNQIAAILGEGRLEDYMIDLAPEEKINWYVLSSIADSAYLYENMCQDNLYKEGWCNEIEECELDTWNIAEEDWLRLSQ